MGRKHECQTAAAGVTPPEPRTAATKPSNATEEELFGVDDEQVSAADAAPRIKDAQEAGEDMEEEEPVHDPVVLAEVEDVN